MISGHRCIICPTECLAARDYNLAVWTRMHKLHGFIYICHCSCDKIWTTLSPRPGVLPTTHIRLRPRRIIPNLEHLNRMILQLSGSSRGISVEESDRGITALWDYRERTLRAGSVVMLGRGATALTSWTSWIHCLVFFAYTNGMIRYYLKRFQDLRCDTLRIDDNLSLLCVDIECLCFSSTHQILVLSRWCNTACCLFRAFGVFLVWSHGDRLRAKEVLNSFVLSKFLSRLNLAQNLYRSALLLS